MRDALCLQVLAGLLHVLQPYEDHVDVFLHPHYRTKNFDGAWGLIKWSRARFLTTSSSISRLKIKYDLVLLVSADYEVEQVGPCPCVCMGDL